MNFSKTASYSLSILSYMASHKEDFMSAAYLHEKLQIPYPYLRQILTSLTKSGFIHSTRGRTGGYTFSKDLKDISLADILSVTDELEGMNKCILGFTNCPFDNKCSMHSIWEETRNNIIKILNNTSLAEITQSRK